MDLGQFIRIDFHGWSVHQIKGRSSNTRSYLCLFHAAHQQQVHNFWYNYFKYVLTTGCKFSQSICTGTEIHSENTRFCWTDRIFRLLFTLSLYSTAIYTWFRWIELHNRSLPLSPCNWRAFALHDPHLFTQSFVEWSCHRRAAVVIVFDDRHSLLPSPCTWCTRLTDGGFTPAPPTNSVDSRHWLCLGFST